MKWTFKNLIKLCAQPDVEQLMRQSEHGLEKECLRVDRKGSLSQQKHPEKLGSPLTHPDISTDFSEAQPELITSYYQSESQALKVLGKLHHFLTETLDQEIPWSSSAPCRFEKDAVIPIAQFGCSNEGMTRHLYRKGLALRYGRKMQTLSGVHYNFSFGKDFIAYLRQAMNPKMDESLFRSELYLHMIRNYLRLGWLNTYLFGATPAVDRSYLDKKDLRLKRIGKDTLYGEYSTSLRMSEIGYYSKVQEQIAVSYNSLEEYIEDLTRVTNSSHPKYRRFGLFKGREQIQLNDYHLQTPAEHYSRIRPKPLLHSNIGQLEALSDGGVQYVEVRGVDLNPFIPDGIEIDQLYFLHQLLIYCAFHFSPPLTKKENREIRHNQNHVALYGRKPGLMLNRQGVAVSMKEWALEILDEMTLIAAILDSKRASRPYMRCLERIREKILNPELTPSAELLTALQVNQTSHQDYIFELSQKHQKAALNTPLSKNERKSFQKKVDESLQQQLRLEVRDEMLLKGYEDMELSTQLILREAEKRRLSVEILDRKDNFLKLTKGRKVAYVKQATKTSRDSLMTYLLMENKVVTKLLLEDAGINVPKGGLYYDLESAVEAYDQYSNELVVVKPNFTNYGHGINFVQPNQPQEYITALSHAFSFGNEVIVEEFLEGEEFRFLVIDNRIAAICKRIPANVIGDGKSTIRQLVHMKNYDPLSYKIPKYHLRLEKEERIFLKGQGLSVQSVPKKGERIFLRANSNVSTGGDALDVTNKIHKGYHKIAIDSAKVVDATFCGVDMMITKPDRPPSSRNYGIVELNFNPALHIHRFALEGEKRHVEKDVLDALGF